jgi:hypothetical protein
LRPHFLLGHVMLDDGELGPSFDALAAIHGAAGYRGESRQGRQRAAPCSSRLHARIV